ncbi:MAG: response regulator transcription factor [Ignavibacteriae bacterium]|nr:response regulator transcription factor [Ignavibacteriota bacterium]
MSKIRTTARQKRRNQLARVSQFQSIGKVRILLVDEQEIVRSGLRKVFQSKKRFAVIADAINSKSAIDLVTEYSPDVIILDIALPEKDDGIETIRKIKEICSVCKILVFTNIDVDSACRQAILAGADGYLLKKARVQYIIEAVNSITKGERFFGPHISKILIAQSFETLEKRRRDSLPLIPKLTKREIQILWYVAQGYSNREIADKLFISFRTVHNHRINLMKKLNIHKTAELVRYAVHNGLVEP